MEYQHSHQVVQVRLLLFSTQEPLVSQEPQELPERNWKETIRFMMW